MRNRVAELRRERNMRQEELAAAAGISRQSIIAIEKGRFNPSLEAAIRIARCSSRKRMAGAAARRRGRGG